MIVCPRCGQENPEGFRFCGACAAPLQQAAPARYERKVVTALFCDLVGSTAQGEVLDPEDLQALLSRYHGQVRQELERFGGTVEKFSGDAVVALFRAPIAHEDDPESRGPGGAGGQRLGPGAARSTPYRATERVIEYREHSSVAAKGKAQPVPVWEAVGARSRLGVDFQHSPRTALVGRERELRLLTEAFERAREERGPQLVTLVGVPGIGTTASL